MGTIRRERCPVCGSSAISPVATATDHTVSKQSFKIWQCAQCSLQFTQDAPDAADAGAYYQSDNYISHSDTSEGLVNRIYHRVRRITLKNKMALVKKTTGLTTGNLLDIGAGTGAFAHAIKAEGWQVTALEPDTATRKRAAELYGLDLQDTAALPSLPDASFDAITMWHVLEHVHELHEGMEHIRRLLSASGKALIAVPNYTSFDAAVYRGDWAAYDVPRHLYHFSPASMKTLLEQHGLRLLSVKPMWFDSFYISLLSEQYKNGHQHFLSALWTGWRSNLKAFMNNRRCSSVIYIAAKA